jgi:predicted nucleic acid-binding protein
MEIIFVDTSAWYALANEKDANHLLAREFLAENRRLVTTNFIIDETITLTLIRAGYRYALSVGEQLLNGQLASIVWVTRDDQGAAWELFKQYDDKMFSFTDCTSFAVMTRLGLRYTFTFDTDFTQTGQFTQLP